MPITKSAAKRMRTSRKARMRNRAEISRIITAKHKLLKAVADGSIEAAKQAVKEYFSLLDKAAKKGIIPANNASRKKSRAAKKLASMTQKQGSAKA